MNATKWYSLFSIIILPINSVINPLIYDGTIEDMIKYVLRKIHPIWSAIISTLEACYVWMTRCCTTPPAPTTEDNPDITAMAPMLATSETWDLPQEIDTAI